MNKTSPNTTLTPVKNRGKRQASSSEQPSGKDRRDKSSQHHRPASKRRKTLAQVMEAAKSLPKARLETLPAEILEEILLHSKEFALPRASHSIGLKLSARATLIRIIITAFHDTWNQWFGIPKDRYHTPLTEKRKIYLTEGDPRYQTAVLGLPWAKLDILLQAQQTWSDRYARNRWFEHSVSETPASRRDGGDHPHGLGGFGHFNARDCFEHDYQKAKNRGPWEFLRPCQTYQDIDKAARPPADILTGPWDEEQERRLFWLFRSGPLLEAVYCPRRDSGTGDEDGDISDGAGGGDYRSRHRAYTRYLSETWETRWECLQNAVFRVSEPNFLVLNLFSYEWLFWGYPSEIVYRETLNLRRRLEWGQHSPDAAWLIRKVIVALEAGVRIWERWHRRDQGTPEDTDESI